MATNVKSLHEILALYPLDQNEAYCLYILRNDGWPYGFIGTYSDPDDLEHIALSYNSRRSVLGVWVTKESHDGTVDITIFKHESIRR